MKWASAHSSDWDTQDAFSAMFATVDDVLSEPSLIAVFCSRAHQTRFAQIPLWLREKYPGAVIIGCSGRGVLGGGEELEREPSAALVAARLPTATLTPFRIPESFHRLDDAEWRAMVGPSPVSIMVLTDSFSCDSDGLLGRLNSVFPGVPVFGGLASSATHPGANALFQNDQFFREGGVGLAFAGDIELKTLVAQGCRPVGDTQKVVRAESNLVLELDRGRPDAWVDAFVDGLDDVDRKLVPRSLFVGVRRDSEWLVRTIVGYDPNSGAMTLTERVEAGDELRFFLRDARASRDDLERELERLEIDASGGFLFSCIGRGEGLYGQPNHDTRLVESFVGPTPVGGFFCAGEFGPVSGRNYVHGYTTTLALFSES